MKTAAVFVAAAAIAACAHAPAKPAPVVARCNDTPQWNIKDAKGQDLGIYVCFGDESRLLYQVRVLPPSPPTPSATTAPVWEKKHKVRR